MKKRHIGSGASRRKPRPNWPSTRLIGRRAARIEQLESRWVLSHVEPGTLIVLPLMPGDKSNAQADLIAPELAGALHALADVPILHSLPGAPATLYLDFDGHFEAVWGAHSNITTPPFDIDGDPATFSDAELARITNIWKRVSEDFAPFNVNVTTQNPGSFLNGVAELVSIGGSGAWLGTPAGGVAYVDNFTSAVPNTVYVFADALGDSEKNIAEAVSHEAGHAFGLHHQSVYDPNGIKLQEYNPGSGNWAPIMGNSYGPTLTTWYDRDSALGKGILQDDMAVMARAQNGFGFRPDDHDNDADHATPLHVVGNSVSAAGIIGTSDDVDVFSFDTDAGPISLTVHVAPLGANLVPVLELRNSFGTLVALSSPGLPVAATISQTVPAGQYTLSVRSVGTYGYVGQYSISGIVNTGLYVLDHTPHEGEVVTTLPTDFVLTFSEDFVPASIDAADLVVNGQAADGFTILDNRLVSFHFNTSPVVAEGLQLMSMAQGAVLRASDQTAIHEFQGTFRYDASPLTVDATIPPNGAGVTLPLTTLRVHFDGAFDPLSVAASDLVVSTGFVSGMQVVNTSTIDFLLSGITQEGTLVYSLPAGAVTDEFGNPSVAFTGTLALDFGTIAFPTPLGPLAPRGSGVFDPPISGGIGFVGDEDRFTIELAAGQQITIVAAADSSLRPQVSLQSPTNATVGTAQAAAVGQDAVIQTILINTPGTYTVVVAGLNGATGGYSLSVVLGAAVESELHDGPINDLRNSAQSLNNAMLDLGGGVTRAVVLGTADPLTSLATEMEPNGSIATANSAVNNFVPSMGLYQLALNASAGVVGDVDWFRIGTLEVGDVLSITQSGSPSSRGTLSDPIVELHRQTGPTTSVLVAIDDDSGPGFDSLLYRTSITTAGTYFIRARGLGSSTGTYRLSAWLERTGAGPSISGSVTAESESNNTFVSAQDLSSSWRAANWRSQTAGTITSGDQDYYLFEFAANDIVTVVAEAGAGLDLSSAILNSSGSIVATEDGSSVGLGGGTVIYGFRVPAAGSYYLRMQATGGTGSYTAGVYVSTTATPPSPRNGLDYYRVDLTAGDVITVGLESQGVQRPLAMRLVTSGGGQLAVGQSTATNIDQVIDRYTAPLTGAYLIEVSGQSGTPYSLMVTHNAQFDQELNDVTAEVNTNLDGTRGAFGHLDANPPPDIGLLTFSIVQNQTFIALSGDLSTIPLQEQTPGSLTTTFQGPVLVDRQEGTVRFTGGSLVDADPQPGLYQPGSVMADFAGKITFGTIVATGIFQDIVIDLTTALLDPPLHDHEHHDHEDHAHEDHAHDHDEEHHEPHTGLTLALPIGTTGDFPSASVIFTLLSGGITYEIPGFTTGSFGLAGLSMPNQAEENSHFEELADRFRITIPVVINANFIEPETSLPFAIHMEGQVVAEYVFPGPVDPVDTYQLTLLPGQLVTLATRTPNDAGSAVPVNGLDPRLVLVDHQGNVVATDDDSAGDGKNAQIKYKSLTGGTYHVQVVAQAGAGDYVLNVEKGELVPPAVTKILVSSSDWKPNFLNHLSSAGLGDGGYAIPAGGSTQLVSLPWVNLNQIKIQFSEDVDVEEGDLSVEGINVSHYAIDSFSYDEGSHVATWTLQSPIGADKVLLKLKSGSTGVEDKSLNALDGEWANSSQQFPSGDGTAGGDFKFRFNVVPGDVDGNNGVNVGDDLQSRARVGLIPGMAQYLVQYDVDGNGGINVADNLLTRQRVGTVLPAGNPTLRAAAADAVFGSLANGSATTSLSLDASAPAAGPIVQAGSSNSSAPTGGTSSSPDLLDKLASSTTSSSPATSTQATEAPLTGMQAFAAWWKSLFDQLANLLAGRA